MAVLDKEFIQAQKNHYANFDFNEKNEEYHAIHAETLELLKQVNRIWVAFKKLGYADVLEMPDDNPEFNFDVQRFATDDFNRRSRQRNRRLIACGNRR